MSKAKKTNANSKQLAMQSKYVKMKDQREHILKRPGTYIGSVRKEKRQMWIFRENGKEAESKLTYKKITFVPGFYKIFDEILVNASDHVIRCEDENLEKCNTIKICVNQESGEISVWNNGAGIPVLVHEEHNLWLPEMLFGHLLTSSNYDDNVQRRVGGTNGLGAKLTNIWSTSFEVETVDSNEGKKFYQKFTDNMGERTKPKITKCSKKPYTKFTFIPDFEKYGITGISNDVYALFKKRAYDIAMTSSAKVYFNDEIVNSNNFSKYIDICFPKESNHKKVIDISDENWKVAVVYDPDDQMEHQNISFVNGICTSRGGTHVEYVSRQVINKIKDQLQKKNKNLDIKPNMIKENLIFFVDAVIINPEFDSQTKEALTTRSSDFGSTYQVPSAFISKILKSGVVEHILANAELRAQANLEKNNGKNKNMHNFQKLADAKDANKKQGDCYLILTEGDSAKTFAMAGLNVIGRKKFGVFPLKGKILNVRDVHATKIAENDEIQAIKSIVGLEYKKVYKSTEGLRYGHIIVLTDQDSDGFHIKGLLINFIHHFWPSLAKHEGFIQSLATPLIKATMGRGKNRTIKEFYSMPEFDEWKNEQKKISEWGIKYYKGLGTSDAQESREAFRDVEDKLITYAWKESVSKKKLGDYEPKFTDVTEDAITLAFSKGREDDRKTWINTYDPTVYIDNAKKYVPYYDFIHKELVVFSADNVIRSIPSIMDGFKPTQRKVLCGLFKKNCTETSIKVSSLAGYVSDVMHYHHGEASLNETIIKMAQHYVGSNNINLIYPDGGFGSRLMGGKDSASPRYIATRLEDITNYIFIKEDFDILEKQYDENALIEPVYFAPIIPMVLVNGFHGVGTGYSTHGPAVNPRDLIANIRNILKGEKQKTIRPWYRHFTGSIEKIDKNKYISRAKYEIKGDVLEITDLPIGTWTDNYKEFLISLTNSKQVANKKTEKKPVRGKKNAGSKKSMAKNSRTAKVAKTNNIGQDIKTWSEDNTDVRVSFTIKFAPKTINNYLKNGTLESNLKLVTPLNLTNMHLFNSDGKISYYKSYNAILSEFVDARLIIYQKRKDYLLGKWKNEMDILKWKLKFIEGVISEEIIVFKKKKDEIITQLEEMEFPKLSLDSESKKKSYDYLTGMTILKFSKDEVDKLRKQIKDKKEQIVTLESKTPSEIWLEELDIFEDYYNNWEKRVDKEYQKLFSEKRSSK